MNPPLSRVDGFGLNDGEVIAELQRAEAINCAMLYPPMMTAAKLPATTARRKAAVTLYSMGRILSIKKMPPADT